MSDWDDPLDHRQLEILAADFSRWETVGQRFEHMAPELLQELAAMRSNPTKHNFHIAANAARGSPTRRRAAQSRSACPCGGTGRAVSLKRIAAVGRARGSAQHQKGLFATSNRPR